MLPSLHPGQDPPAQTPQKGGRDPPTSPPRRSPLVRGRRGVERRGGGGIHTCMFRVRVRPALLGSPPPGDPSPLRGGGRGAGARPQGDHHPPAPRGRPGAAAAAAKWRRGGADQAPPLAVLHQSEPPAAAATPLSPSRALPYPSSQRQQRPASRGRCFGEGGGFCPEKGRLSCTESSATRTLPSMSKEWGWGGGSSPKSPMGKAAA